jgi:hypothetical protein
MARRFAVFQNLSQGGFQRRGSQRDLCAFLGPLTQEHLESKYSPCPPGVRELSPSDFA